MLDLTAWVVLFSSIFIITVFILCNSQTKRPILEVYQVPNRGYWLKVYFIFVILYMRKVKHNFKKIILKNPDKFIAYKNLEKVQKLSFHDQAIDAVYFNGTSSKGDVLITGMARRKHGLIDGFLYLRIEESGIGLLESPKLPSTTLLQEKNNKGYSAEGIEIKPVEPMKIWRITYKGKMKKHKNPEEMFDVEIDAVWYSEQPFFNFDTDMDEMYMAKTIALEKWSRNYFQIMKEVHQTHYEQHGNIIGKVKINRQAYNININALRDHTFGNHRNWHYFHRYGLHFFTSETGDRFMVGSICMPIVFSSLYVGYVYSNTDKKIYPVEDCDFHLYQHGEDGDPPKDYAFSFTAGGKRYVIQVIVHESPVFYLSKDWEVKVVESLCNFKINGKNGWGAAEFLYYNSKGRNAECKSFQK